MNKTIILDIETKVNNDLVPIVLERTKPPATYKNKEKITEWKNDFAQNKLDKVMKVDVDYADILCIYVGIVKDGKLDIVREANLEEVLNWIELETKIVTYNGKNFDIPLLRNQAIKQGLSVPLFMNRLMKRRYYDNDQHIDLMEVICGNRKAKSLDELCEIYLKKPKKEIDFKTATDDEIKEHCKEDIQLTYEIFNMFRP